MGGVLDECVLILRLQIKELTYDDAELYRQNPYRLPPARVARTANIKIVLPDRFFSGFRVAQLRISV